MIEMPRKYEKILDLPNCECGNKKIDENNLQDYSDDILKNVLKEVKKTIKNIPIGPVSFPCRAIDEVGINNWFTEIDNNMKYYTEIKMKLEAEIEKRHLEKKENNNAKKKA